MRILTIIATAALFALPLGTAAQADGHSGSKCVPYGCYDR